MSSSPVRVAIAGLGDAGFAMHLPALSSLSGAVVVGVCDHSEERQKRAAGKWKVAVFADAADMIAACSPELLIVATPPGTHADLCIMGLEAGANVLCEKPFVQTLDEADRVLDASARTGRRVALNHEFREMPIFKAILDAARARDAGELAFAQAWQLMYMPPWEEHGWRGEMERRTLHEAGVHLIDFLIALFGELPHAVSGTMSSGGMREGESDAVCVVTLEFSRGRIAQLIQNRLCKGETHYFEVRADTTNASFRASFGGRARVTTGLHRSTIPHLRVDYGVSGIAWREKGPSRTFLARNPRDPRMVATRSVIEQTLAAFASGMEPPASGADGRGVLRVIDACYAAAVSGRRTAIEVDDHA